MSLLKALNLPATPAPGRAAAGSASASASASTPADPAGGGRMAEAAAAWRTAQQQAEARIGLLKAAVLKQAGEQPEATRRAIEQGLKKLDAVLAPIGEGLGEAMSAGGAASRKTAKDAVAAAIERLRGEPLVAHIDANPYGVKTDVKGLLSAALAKAAQAIG